MSYAHRVAPPVDIVDLSLADVPEPEVKEADVPEPEVKEAD